MYREREGKLGKQRGLRSRDVVGRKGRANVAM